MYWVGVLLLGIIVVAYTTSMGVIECVTIRTFGLWRRVSISSQECVQYFATFIDKYSTKARLYFVKTILIMFLHYLKNGINSHA